MTKSQTPSPRHSDGVDHLIVIAARAKNSGKRTYSAAEVRAKLGLSSTKC